MIRGATGSRNDDPELLFELARTQQGDADGAPAADRRDPSTPRQPRKHCRAEFTAEVMAAFRPVDARAARGHTLARVPQPRPATIGERIHPVRMRVEEPATEERAMDVDRQRAGEMRVTAPSEDEGPSRAPIPTARGRAPRPPRQPGQALPAIRASTPRIHSRVGSSNAFPGARRRAAMHRLTCGGGNLPFAARHCRRARVRRPGGRGRRRARRESRRAQARR